MKKVIYAILVMILSVPLCGYTVKGGVTYTVETARKETFANVEYTLPKSIIEANKVDPNYQENMKAKAKGKNRLKDRTITYFSDGGYAIIYNNNRYYEYYYSCNGKLESVGKRTGLIRPCKSYKYDVNGELIIVALYVSVDEAYTFDVNGKLQAHWIKNKCYDLNGNVIEEKY